MLRAVEAAKKEAGPDAQSNMVGEETPRRGHYRALASPLEPAEGIAESVQQNRGQLVHPSKTAAAGEWGGREEWPYRGAVRGLGDDVMRCCGRVKWGV
ncbi:hypothetical protein NDU88_002765 [Pleurodeles waltl]|uniref:Uncharacterized protein n=1 Tax=Pleurodeles waltl TaxID=8319 RepID=A0AAV7QDM9_PLEWA|nr:hypothetical protein NDU88_002765 [Pleurodeles waltl]